MPDAMTRRRALGSWVPFAGIVLTLYAAWGVVIRIGAFERHPAALTAGAAVDLLGVVTLAYWALVVRAGRAHPRSMITVVALSFIGARLLLPAGAVERLAIGRIVLAAGELALVAWAISRLRRTARASEADLKERIDAVCQSALPNAVAARVVAAEMATLAYALRRRPRTAPSATAFTVAPSLATALLCTLVGISVAEIVPVHLLISRWSVRAAWLVTALGLYSVVWLVGHFRAVPMRRCTVTPEGVVVRVGLRCDATLAPERIAAATTLDWRAAAALLPSVYRPSRPAEPNVLVTLHEPAVILGTMGIRRTVSGIALRVDDPAGFVAAIRSVMSHAEAD